MSNIEEKLLARARSRYGRIQPCAGKSLSQCFFYQNDCLQFWFNDLDGNTHLVYAPGEKPA
jgi:hypothetical protein